jgi:transcriptional regulator with XRE-family HTH domain
MELTLGGLNMKETFGHRFTALRKEKGYTQESIATKLHITAQAVSKWENDTSLPDVSMLEKIADLLETSVDYLLGRVTPQVVAVSPGPKKEINRLVFKINITSSEGDLVKVNLPLPIIIAALDSGVNPKINGKDILGNIDIKMILGLIEQGVLGKMVEIDSKDGDHVTITIE